MRALYGQRFTITGYTDAGIPTASYGDLWTPGTTIPQIAGGGIQIAVASSGAGAANDTNTAGTGCRQVRIHYIDATTSTHKFELMNMNGVTRVNSVATDVLRFLGSSCVTLGSGGVPAGNLIWTDTGGVTTYFQHDLGFNVSTVGTWTVPSFDRNGIAINYLVIDEIRCSTATAAANSVNVRLLVEADPNVATLPFAPVTAGIFYNWYDLQLRGGTEVVRSGLSLPPIGPGTMIKINAKASAAGQNLAVSFSGILQ